MTLPKKYNKSVKPLKLAMLSLALVNAPVMASGEATKFTPKVVNFTTIDPVPPTPVLLPYGYRETARAIPQVIMAGVSPSVIDLSDTSFEILALVRPGNTPLQTVTIGQVGNPFVNFGLKHINTLKNGDQFWKIRFEFDKGTFGVQNFPIKWGNGTNQFFIRATDNTSASTNANPFPQIRFANSPSQTVSLNTTKNDELSYNKTRRSVAQIIMAGVSPAIVDILDTSFDIVTIVRPGILPIQKVILKQGDNKLFSIAMEKKKELSNGDQIWVSNFAFPQGNFGTSTIPVVFGTDSGEYNVEVTDAAQQVSIGYPILRSGTFPILQ